MGCRAVVSLAAHCVLTDSRYSICLVMVFPRTRVSDMPSLHGFPANPYPTSTGIQPYAGRKQQS